MASKINVGNYESMISALQDFITKVSESCDDMQAAGKTCVDTTENDPAAVSGFKKLSKCIKKYEEITAKAAKLVSNMQAEVAEAKKVYTIVNSED